MVVVKGGGAFSYVSITLIKNPIGAHIKNVIHSGHPPHPTPLLPLALGGGGRGGELEFGSFEF